MLDLGRVFTGDERIRELREPKIIALIYFGGPRDGEKLLNLNRLLFVAAIAIVLFSPEPSVFLVSSGLHSAASAEMAGKQPHPLPSEIGEKQKDAGAAASSEPKPLTAPLHVEVPTRPWAFQANGKWHLVYELHVANIGNVGC